MSIGGALGGIAALGVTAKILGDERKRYKRKKKRKVKRKKRR
ncbi:MAG: hypothetical protein ACTSXY_12400 [Promethearchaeota archaeon]